MDLFNAIKKPFTDLKNLLIGIVLNLIPIINFLSLGYALECSGVGDNKPSAKLPPWRNWGDLFIKGLLAVIITLIYSIPIIILSGVFFGGKVIETLKTETFQGFGGMQGYAGTQLLGIGAGLMAELLILLVVALLISYIIPAAILSYLNKKSIGAAFNFSAIFKKTFNSKYLVTWLVVLIIGIVLAWITMLFFDFGQTIYWIAASVFGFINYVITYTLFGEVFKKVKV